MQLEVLNLPLFTLPNSVFTQQVGAEVFLHHKGPSAKQSHREQRLIKT